MRILSYAGEVLRLPPPARARGHAQRGLGMQTRVLVEQTTVVDPRRLGDSAGRLGAAELRAVDEALRLIVAL
jgi:mRNA-degrading endonuclease toxin of MazEF toxin-antitoxin module